MLEVMYYDGISIAEIRASVEWLLVILLVLGLPMIIMRSGAAQWFWCPGLFTADTRGKNSKETFVQLSSSAPRIFPAPSRSFSASCSDTWLLETVARLYEVDFNPDQPATLPVQLPQSLASKLQDVMAALPAQMGAAPHQNCSEPLDIVWAARALVATDFDVERASDLMREYAGWRGSNPGLTKPVQAWLDFAIVIVPFEDRHGRPVALSRLQAYHSGLPLEQMTNGYRATADGVIAHLVLNRGLTISRTNPLEQWILCIDCQGAGWQNFSMEYVRMFVQESKHRYMERISVIYLLNPPAAWRLMWSIMTPILHPRTLRKIRLVHSAKVPETMCELLGDKADELLPPCYGGKAAPFAPPGKGKTLEEKVGTLLANTWRRIGMTLPEEGLDESRNDESGVSDYCCVTGRRGSCADGVYRLLNLH